MRPSSAIRQARRDAGLTQTELAQRAGTSQATLSAYESGTKMPSIPTLERLLNACDRRLAVAPALRTRAELARSGERLSAVLELAESLPFSRPGPLRYPRLPQ